MTESPDRSHFGRTARQVALASLAGVMLGLAWSDGPLRAPLALLFLLPYFAAVRGASAARRIALTWLLGALSVAIATGETADAALGSYFGLAGAVRVLAWIAAHQVLGVLPLLLFGVLVDDVERRSPARVFVDVGAAWVACESLRGLLFPGAWLSLASTLAESPAWIQSAAWVGGAGVSFWLAGFGALVFRVAHGPDRRRAGGLAFVVAVLLAAQATTTRSGSDGGGRIHPDADGAAPEDSFEVGLVQSGIDSRTRPSRPTDASDLARLLELSRMQARGVDLLVWPEGSLRGVWPANAEILTPERIRPIEAGHLLVGAPWMDDANGTGSLSAAGILLDRDARILARHRKTRLVPIAEDRPPFAPATDDEIRALSIEQARLGVSICYEGLFGSIARRLVADGADVLVDLSNESWLGATMQGQKHMLAAAVLRSVELRRPTLRATSTGITAAIDARGRIVARLPPGARSAVLRARVSPSNERTPVARFGSIPVVVASWAWTLLSRRPGRTARLRIPERHRSD